MPIPETTVIVITVASILGVTAFVAYICHLFSVKKAKIDVLTVFFPHGHKPFKSLHKDGLQPDDGCIYHDTVTVLFEFLVEKLPDLPDIYPLEFSLVFKKEEQYVLTKTIENYQENTRKLLFALDDTGRDEYDDIKDLSRVLASPGLWNVTLMVESLSKVLYQTEFEVVGRDTLAGHLSCVSSLIVPVNGEDYNTNSVLCSNKSVIPTFVIEAQKYDLDKFATCDMWIVLVDEGGIRHDHTPIDVQFNEDRTMVLSFSYEREFSEGTWFFELHANDKAIHRLPIHVFDEEPKTGIKTTICGINNRDREIVLEDDIHLLGYQYIMIKAECVTTNPIPWLNHKIRIAVNLLGDKESSTYEADTSLAFSFKISTVRFRPFQIPEKCCNGKRLSIDVSTFKDDELLDESSVSLRIGVTPCTDVQGRLVGVKELNLNVKAEHARIMEEIKFG